MQRVRPSDLPLFIRAGGTFQNFPNPTDEDDDDGMDIPIKYMKFDDVLNSIDDVHHYLSTLRYWDVQNVIPASLVSFYMKSLKRTIRPITVEYSKHIPLLKVLQEIHEARREKRMEIAAGGGLVEVMHYFSNSHYVNVAEVCNAAAKGGHLECLEYARELGYPWGEETTLSAVRHNHFQCLQFALQNGCPISRHQSMEVALKFGSVPILRLLHEHGISWPNDTTVILTYRGALEHLIYAHNTGCEWRERTCAVAASHGHLDCLRFAHEQGGCSLTFDVAQSAAMAGHLDCLVYAYKNGCPLHEGNLCGAAASSGHVDCLRFLHEHGCALVDGICESAVRGGSVACLQYLHEQGCSLNAGSKLCVKAAELGHLQSLIYLREVAKVEWDEDTTYIAARRGKVNCLAYAHEHGCPWSSKVFYAAEQSGVEECVAYVVRHGCPSRKNPFLIL